MNGTIWMFVFDTVDKFLWLTRRGGVLLLNFEQTVKHNAQGGGALIQRGSGNTFVVQRIHQAECCSCQAVAHLAYGVIVRDCRHRVLSYWLTKQFIPSGRLTLRLANGAGSHARWQAARAAGSR
jgi:hypothetical protein